jgi:hypothetical protein
MWQNIIQLYFNNERTYKSVLYFLLQVVLCFSPVGSTLRVRSRKFPAVTNCTCIDWFHEWPIEALDSVSTRFLQEVELLSVSIYTWCTFLLSVCPFVLFLLTIVLSVLLWYTDYDYPFGIFKLFSYKPGDKSWKRKGPGSVYDKWNISVVICDVFNLTKRKPWFSSFLVSSNPLSRKSW